LPTTVQKWRHIFRMSNSTILKLNSQSGFRIFTNFKSSRKKTHFFICCF
jgi:hypothetical protein